MYTQPFGVLPRVCLMIMAAALWLSPVQADESAGAVKLKKALELVELRQAFKDMPEQLISGLDQLPAESMADVRRAELLELAKRLFGADALLDDVRGRMTGEVTPAQLDAVIGFYSSPLGRKLVAMEVAASGSDSQARIETEGASLYAEIEKNDPDRVAAFDRIESAIRMEDMMSSMIMNMSYAMISGMAGTSMLPQELTDEQIAALVNQQMEATRGLVAQFLNNFFAYTYRDASNADLEGYAAFTETESGRAFNTVLVRAMIDAMVQRSRAFGHGLMVLRGVRRT